MKKILIVSVLVLLMSISIISLAVADHGDPVNDCPSSKWTLHHAGHLGDHAHNGDHKHVGNDSDRNGDGWICGKHVGNEDDVHVHIDNNVKFRD